MQGLQEAGVFSNAVQAGQARLEKSLQQEKTSSKRASSVKVEPKQTAVDGDSRDTEISEAAKSAIRVAAMPPQAPPGLDLNSTGSSFLA